MPAGRGPASPTIQKFSGDPPFQSRRHSVDYKQFFQVVRRRWLTIGLVLGLAVGAALFISLRMTPEYESKARIFISVDVRNSTDLSSAGFFTAGRVTSYATLATSAEVMDQVIADLDLPTTPDRLADTVKAEVVPDTTLIEITVTDPDPSQAQAIGRAVSQRLTEYLTDLETPSGASTTQIVARVADPANFNDDAVSPRTVLNLVVAGVIGLLIGIAVAVTRDLLDRTVHSLDHVQEQTNSPVLASISHDKGIKKHPLLTDLSGFAPRTEAFRMLRTNLQFLDIDHQPRCIVISSAVPGEGKTMTSTNLAVALAQAGRRTLVIDGDLRRPRVEPELPGDAAVGLTTVLLGKAEAKDAIQVHEPSGLHLLSSGAKPPNPTEILQSRVTRDLIMELRDAYDMVIIDAPPLLPVADASVLSTIADGTILVVKHGRTTRDQLREALGRLEQVGGRLFGVVVNMIPRRATNNYYYYYYEETTGTRKAEAKPRRNEADPEHGMVDSGSR